MADLPENNEYKVVTDSEEQIAAVVAPAEETETTDVQAEPEVIGPPKE